MKQQAPMICGEIDSPDDWQRGVKHSNGNALGTKVPKTIC